MNLFYIHTHDMGRYNSLYGYAINTPNMRALAEDSTLFRCAHCASPTCSPSRGALLTGMSPHSNGLMGLAHRGSRIEKTHAHLARYLSAQGYRSVLFGVQHETYHDAKSIRDELGYDEAYPDQYGEIAAEAAKYIESYRGGEPLFMSVGFMMTHRPYASHSVDPDYVALPPCIPDSPETRADYADYVTSCEQYDRSVGELISAIKQAGMYDDSVILFTTDHGIAFPFMKCSLYDAGTGVTLAIKPAKGESHVKLSDALVSQLDVYPTLCDLLTLPRPDWLEGKSMLPLIRGERAEINDCIFTEITFHAAYEPVRAVRAERYKYIRHFDPELSRQVLPNVDDGLTKRYLLERGFAARQLAAEELYDLCFDPQERDNLIDRQEYAALADEMRSRLSAWMERTGDPLLNGPVPSRDVMLNSRFSLNPSMTENREVIGN